jgi:hypothetical protein
MSEKSPNEMNAAKAKEILDKVVAQVFGYQNPFSLEQAMQKFAFDRRLPQQVYDSTTNQPTWAISPNPSKYMSIDNIVKRNESGDWERPKRALNTIDDILAAWSETNFVATERQVNSVNVAESDDITNSENVYRSFDIRNCKNILFTEGCQNSEFIVGGFAFGGCSFCIRVEESGDISNSFSVNWSNKVSNSFFMQGCNDCMDCMFCSHVSGKRFCIANMQFDEAEYNKLKTEVIKWILTS